MLLSNADWLIIWTFFIVSLGIGIWASKKAGKSSSEFFLSGRNMPWWLLGVSMVATTFSADTPNLVTDIVRQHGISGNWVWWAFLLTGMLTTFVFARLWRRSGALTDLEFYELRYGGKPAAWLRGFRAIYLGVFFNVMIMATVCLAAIKIGGVMLGLTPIQILLIASVVTVIYSALGGLRGVIITDFVQFIIAMVGSVAAAWVVINLPEVGGLGSLLEHPNVSGKLDFLPDFTDRETFLTVLILPLAVQWWSVWYPGSEPGGGGYIAQRMLSARTENHALGATLFFNIAHYALRPWPWLLIALASLVVFPDLASIQAAFPDVPANFVKHDLAYPAMLTYLPHGLLGMVLASLIAAFMSTISTHLNWGSSYVVHDFYKRFYKRDAAERELVLVGRISTVLLMVLAAIVALYLENAYRAFQILLQIGAGTGLIFILRWFWWRINAWSEITAMAFSLIMAVYLELIHPEWFGESLAASTKLLLQVGITTAVWSIATFLTRPTPLSTLVNFYQKIQPGGRGWDAVRRAAKREGMDLAPSPERSALPRQVLLMFYGVAGVYAALFATGFFIYGEMLYGGLLAGVAGVAALGVYSQMRGENRE